MKIFGVCAFCGCEREREGEGERESERERARGRERERETIQYVREGETTALAGNMLDCVGRVSSRRHTAVRLCAPRSSGADPLPSPLLSSHNSGLTCAAEDSALGGRFAA